MACRILLLDQGLSPSPWQWKSGVLTTGPPGNSLELVFFLCASESRSVMSNSLWPHGLYGILQVRILEWVAFPFSRGSSQSRDWTQVSLIAGDSFFFFFNLFIYFNWRLITLKYCSGFCHTLTWISHGCTCVPHPIPQGHPCTLVLGALSHASNLDWWSISHMITYMFQCYSLKSSHPRLLPQSPKVCSLHLYRFCCLTYRVIITIFLNSIYMH